MAVFSFAFNDFKLMVITGGGHAARTLFSSAEATLVPLIHQQARLGGRSRPTLSQEGGAFKPELQAGPHAPLVAEAVIAVRVQFSFESMESDFLPHSKHTLRAITLANDTDSPCGREEDPQPFPSSLYKSPGVLEGNMDTENSRVDLV